MTEYERIRSRGKRKGERQGEGKVPCTNMLFYIASIFLSTYFLSYFFISRYDIIRDMEPFSSEPKI
jgi:hypothetical protein